MSLARSVPTIIAGSAASGFGFSLGRDVYRGAKTQLGWIVLYGVLLAVFILPIGGTFFAFRMMALNYASARMAVSKRLAALILLVVSLVVGAVPLLFVGGMLAELLPKGNAISTVLAGPIYPLEYWSSRPTLWLTGEGISYGAPLVGNDWVVPKWFLISALALAGTVSGLFARRRRAAMFEAILHNKRFMADVGLVELAPNEFQDSEGNHYRFEDRSAHQIVLFPLGRRNRRAFLDLDATGRFSNWSGLVRI